MQVLLNNYGYISSYAIIGDLVNGIEVPEPLDMQHFEENYAAYKIVDNNLVFDEEELNYVNNQNHKEALREQREIKCFQYVNRGKLWYDKLTPEQIAELEKYYNDWLNVTNTLVAPDKPGWLN